MIRSNTVVNFVLVIIFLLSLVIRLYRIDAVGLYSDETNGNYWMSYQIAKPGNGLASDFTKIIYLTFSPAIFLGFNTLGARANSIIFSSTFVMAFYFVARIIAPKRQYLALVFSLLVALIPWSYMIGRIGHTQIPIITLLSIVHIGLFIQANTEKRYVLSILPLIISFFYYQSMVVVGGASALLVLYCIFSLLCKGKRMFVFTKYLIVFSIILLLVNNQYHFLSVASRGMDLAIWRDVNTTWETDKYRAISWTSEPSIFSFNMPPENFANKIVFNKVIANISIFTKNYLSFFSPEWLFLKGDPILRHSTGMVGAFYPFLLPFMVYGAFKFFSNAEKKARITFLVWILVSPVPAAITKDGSGYLLRAVTMLPFLTYFCALGIVESFNLIRKNWRIPYGIVLGAVALYSAYYFFYGYFHVYPILSERSFEYGFKELSDFQVKENGAPLLVLWDGYYHNGDFRFWQKTPYDQYESFKLKQLVYGETTVWQTFPNLYFSNPKSVLDIQKFLKTNPVKYVVLPDRYFLKYPEEIAKILSPKPVEEIEYPDKTTALSIYTVK